MYVYVFIISIVKPTRCTNVSNLFYFGMFYYSNNITMHGPVNVKFVDAKQAKETC